jgi:hypothetical protein
VRGEVVARRTAADAIALLTVLDRLRAAALGRDGAGTR